MPVSFSEVINAFSTIYVMDNGSKSKSRQFNPTYYGPFRATPDKWDRHNLPPISYACSTCAILMKLSEIKLLDK